MWRITMFKPGNIIRLGNNKIKSSPVLKEVEFSFPARVHITLIDSNRFDFGKPGAGGMGFAVRMDNKISLSLHEKDTIIAPKYIKPILIHVLHIMKKVFSYKGGIRIALTLDSFFMPHKGLGYTTTITTSTMAAINKLFGSRLPDDSIKELVSINYGEVKNNKIVRGTETGVGPHLVLYGGFVVVGGESRVIYSNHFLPKHKLILIDPGSIQYKHKGSENVAIMYNIQNEDISFRYYKAYMTLMDLIPALYSNDIERIGSIIWRFQYGGNNLYEFEKYPDKGKRMLEIMRAIRYTCGPKAIVGFSSVGPVIYAITQNTRMVEDMCRRFEVSWRRTNIDNTGLCILNQRA